MMDGEKLPPKSKRGVVIKYNDTLHAYWREEARKRYWRKKLREEGEEEK